MSADKPDDLDDHDQSPSQAARKEQREQQEQKKQKKQKKQREQTDTVSHAASTAQVAKQKTSTIPGGLYWALGALLIVIAITMWPSQSKQTPDTLAQQTQPSMNNFQAHDELTGNMALLHDKADRLQTKVDALTDAMATTTSVPVSSTSTQGQSKKAKKYLARQNAPTGMYSTGGHSTTIDSAKKSSAPSVLADSGSNARFANQTTTSTAVAATRITHPRFTIASGEFIHAVLETAINSDLPGMVRAIISRPVYATVGEKPLIPAGSRLIGQYTANIAHGQERVMVIWNRVILPNGTSVQINSPSTDALGRAGQGANAINRHFISRFGQAALLSIIGAGVAGSGVHPQDQYNSASEYRSAIAQSFRQSAQQSLQSNASTKPTLHVYQGAKLTVFVAHDVDFYSVLTNDGQSGS